MTQGFLRVYVTRSSNKTPIEGARILVRDRTGMNLHTYYTNTYGTVPTMQLSAPDPAKSLDPNYLGQPFSTFDMEVHMFGYNPIYIYNIQIFSGQTSIQPISMNEKQPDAIARGDLHVEHIFISDHPLVTR